MTTATEDKELLAGLTEEERAMLAEGDDEADTDKDDADAADDQDDNDEGGDAGNDDAAGAGNDDDTGSAAGRDDGDGADDPAGKPEGQAQPGTQSAPLLVAEAPADADAKLKDIADQKEALINQFDDGDITAKEYQQKLDALAKQEREIELAQHKAQIAAEMAQQQARNEFLDYAKKFTSEIHPEYAKDQALYEALDKQVIELANLPKYANMTGQEILEKAHKLILIDHPDAFAAPAKPAADAGRKPAPRPSLPPNLSKVPAADMNDTGEGRFAHLDRLAERGGMEFERALAKLSESEREAYLAA